MLLTEEEAKTKWCPFVSHGVIARERATPDQEAAENSSRCIAAKCMAWRWSDERAKGTILTVEKSDGTSHEIFRGYCGLAGKAES